MPVLHLEKLRASELRALPRDRTLVFLPLGTIESHGDALPMGLDLIEAEALSIRTAEKMGKENWVCVLAPTAALSVDANTGSSGIRVRPHVLRDYLVDFCDSLAAQGFRYFIALSGNPGPRQLTAIEEAGKFLKKRHLRFRMFPNAKAPVLVSGNSVVIDDAEKSVSHLFMSPTEHGGERDAGVALACSPELVDVGLLKALPRVDIKGTLFQRWRDARNGKTLSYWGNPAAGDAAKGNTLLDEKATTLVTKLKAAIEGGKPHFIFKSWYSLVPTNQSLFKIWILVVCLAIILGGWVMLALNSFLKGADFS
jgi:creatinine amidohydrolase/Fe(II)-dependent formamide hydrolase-like protein